MCTLCVCVGVGVWVYLCVCVWGGGGASDSCVYASRPHSWVQEFLNSRNSGLTVLVKYMQMRYHSEQR